MPARFQGCPCLVVRRGGHQAAVRVHASQLPGGVSAEEVVIDGKKPAAAMTLRASAEAAVWTGAIELTAETEIDGQPQTLRVRPAAVIHDGASGSARFTQILPLAVLPKAKKK